MTLFADYIFIGKVDKYLGSYYNPEKNIMVYSNYLVDISKNLKGNLIDKVQLDMYGGADGPTSIFIAGKLNGDNFIFMIVVGIILLILAGVIFYKRKH